MYEIILGNDHLDLYSDSSTRIEIRNPIFASIGELSKSYSYPFKCPLTAQNKRLFSFAQIINNVNAKKVYACEVRKNGIKLYSADLVINEISNSEVEANLQINRKLDFLGKNMNEMLNLGGFFMSSTKRLSFFVNCYAPLKIWVSGVFFEQKEAYNGSEDFDAYSLRMITALISQINAHPTVNGYANYSSAEKTLIIDPRNAVNDFWVCPICDTKSSQADLQYSAFGFNNTFVFNTLVPTSAHNADTFAFASALALDANQPVVFPKINTDGKILNEFADGYFFNGGPDDLDKSPTLLNAQLRTVFAIKKIFESNLWKVESDFFDEIKDHCIFSNQVNVCFRFADQEIPSTEKYFMYAWKLPNMTFLAFLQNFEKNFNCYIKLDFDRKIVKFNSIKKRIQQTDYQEYTDYSPEYSKKLYAQNGSRKFEYSNLPSFCPENPSKEDVAKEDFIKITPKTAYLGVGLENANSSVVLDIPFCPVLSPNNEQAKENSLYFKEFYSPLMTYLLPNEIPKLFFVYAFVDGYNAFPVGNVNNRNLSLQWQINYVFYGINYYFGDIGSFFAQSCLYEKFWKIWDKWLESAQIVKRKIYLTTAELQVFDATKILRIERTNYLLLSATYDLTNKNVRKHIVDCELMMDGNNQAGALGSGSVGAGTGGSSGSGDGGAPTPAKIYFDIKITEVFAGSEAFVIKKVESGQNFEQIIKAPVGSKIISISINGVDEVLDSAFEHKIKIVNVLENKDIMVTFSSAIVKSATFLIVGDDVNSDYDLDLEFSTANLIIGFYDRKTSQNLFTTWTKLSENKISVRFAAELELGREIEVSIISL